MAKIYAGWSFGSIGEATLGWTDNTGSYEVDFSTGTYAHVDLQSFTGTGNYDDFATALKAAMEALSGRTFTISYSTSSMAYTIDPDAGNITLAASPAPAQDAAYANMARILGFNSLPTVAAGSISSQIVPYYVIDTEVDGQSAVSDDYEPDGIAFDGEMDDGTSTGLSRTSAPTYFDWTQAMEPKASVFTRSATAAAPWTYQDLWQHARNVEPIYYAPDTAPSPTTAACFKLRADGASWKPQRVTADYDGQWNIPFRCRLVGR